VKAARISGDGSGDLQPRAQGEMTMKRLIASFALLGLVAAPALAATTAATSKPAAANTGKVHKSAKKTAKVNKAAPAAAKTSG
jgi:hypothetical protein